MPDTGRKDLAVGKQRVNALLFFPLANACLQGFSFLFMDPDEVEDLMVTGHPEQMEEKIKERSATRDSSAGRETPATLST